MFYKLIFKNFFLLFECHISIYTQKHCSCSNIKCHIKTHSFSIHWQSTCWEGIQNSPIHSRLWKNKALNTNLSHNGVKSFILHELWQFQTVICFEERICFLDSCLSCPMDPQVMVNQERCLSISSILYLTTYRLPLGMANCVPKRESLKWRS